jgi:hypothetical protein
MKKPRFCGACVESPSTGSEHHFRRKVVEVAGVEHGFLYYYYAVIYEITDFSVKVELRHLNGVELS